MNPALLEMLRKMFGMGGEAQASPMPAGGNIPIPTQRPQASLPNGSFAPQQAPNAPIPIPTPRPSGQPGGVMPDPIQQVMQQQPAQAAQPMDPLRRILSGGVKDYARRFGAGAGNLRATGGDPFRMFGQGFGGATNYSTAREDAAAAAAAKGEQKDYDRSQDMYQREMDETEMALRKATEARLERTSRLANQKTVMELKREARRAGITVSEMLRIEEEARKQAEAFSGYGSSPEEIEESYQQIKERMVEEAGGGNKGLSDGGLSGGSGKGEKPITATGPNGEKLILKNGQWAPYDG